MKNQQIYILIIFMAGLILFTASPVQAVDCCCGITGTTINCINVPAGGCDPNGAYPSPQSDNSVDTCQEIAAAINEINMEVLTGTPQPTSWLGAMLGNNYGLIPPECRQGPQKSASDCGVNELIEVMVNIARLILGVLGSFALLMFIYGGVIFIISFGNQEKVGTAKKILTNAVIGIIIVLTAWVIVNFLIIAVTGEKLSSIGQIFGRPWTSGPPRN